MSSGIFARRNGPAILVMGFGGCDILDGDLRDFCRSAPKFAFFSNFDWAFGLADAIFGFAAGSSGSVNMISGIRASPGIPHALAKTRVNGFRFLGVAIEGLFPDGFAPVGLESRWGSARGLRPHRGAFPGGGPHPRPLPEFVPRPLPLPCIFAYGADCAPFALRF